MLLGSPGTELDLCLPSDGPGMWTKPLPFWEAPSSFMKGGQLCLSDLQELTMMTNAVNMAGMH